MWRGDLFFSFFGNMKKQGASCPDFVNAEEKPLLLRLCGAGTAERELKRMLCRPDHVR